MDVRDTIIVKTALASLCKEAGLWEDIKGFFRNIVRPRSRRAAEVAEHGVSRAYKRTGLRAEDMPGYKMLGRGKAPVAHQAERAASKVYRRLGVRAKDMPGYKLDIGTSPAAKYRAKLQIRALMAKARKASEKAGASAAAKRVASTAGLRGRKDIEMKRSE